MNDRIYVPAIWTVSILIPLAVGILLTPGLLPKIELGFNPLVLPKLNATINSTVSVLLIAGFIFIRAGKIRWHRLSMLSAFILSAFFLVSYVLYHLSAGHTPYCGDGLVAPAVYYVTLISHILLSVTIVPLASFSIYRALSENFDRHRRIAKITFPLWLYVSVTGVLVYLFIAPCYGVA
jgi:putative membrane protein